MPDRRRTAVLEGVASLLRSPLSTAEHDFARRAIDLAEELTDSRIGYLHYVNDDDDTIELGTWSTRTVALCQVVSDRHYPISAAGIWADAFRQRCPQVHNDFDAETTRRGLPEGHAPLTRHLGVAAVDGDGRVRLLLGVGNKPEPYDDDDVAAVQAVADDGWLMIERLREHHQQGRQLRTLAERSGLSPRGIWEWDPDTREVTFSPGAQRVIAAVVGHDSPDAWRTLMELVPASAVDELRAAITTTGTDDEFVLETHTRPGAARPTRLRITGRWVPRSRGHGLVVHGTLDDVTLLDTVEAQRHRATHDSLTGLLNRASILDELGRRMRASRRSDDEFAVHFVDLDGFKAVNDQHGHLVGDGVLAEVAARLRAATREGDLVARLGGDEFLVVQTAGPTRDDIDALGARLVAAVSEPIVVGGITAHVGASVGVSRSTDSLPGVEALLDSADRALYRAKERRGTVVVSAPGPLRR